VSEALEVEGTRTIDIDKFVPEEEIDKRYYERPYYVVPDELPIKARTQKRAASELRRAPSGWRVGIYPRTADLPILSRCEIVALDHHEALLMAKDRVDDVMSL
jgi:hypothetical protein